MLTFWMSSYTKSLSIQFNLVSTIKSFIYLYTMIPSALYVTLLLHGSWVVPLNPMQVITCNRTRVPLKLSVLLEIFICTYILFWIYIVPFYALMNNMYIEGFIWRWTPITGIGCIISHNGSKHFLWKLIWTPLI